MSTISDTVTRVALEKVQLILTSVTLLGLVAYVGKQLAVSEQQSRMLESIAADLSVMKERNADSSAQIRVIGERVSQVEKRLERIEARP
jgi:hypothetical protein